MAIDGIYLYSLVEDLKKSIINSKIDKINQPEKDEIILTIRKERKNLKLLISSSSKYPRIHITQLTKSNPLQAPMFCMVLRKYLIGGKIIDIVQHEGDRIIKLIIEATDELGFNSIYTLVVEIMGRHSNITLVRDRDNKIMESIKHIYPNVNSFRVLYPGTSYIYPPKSDKVNPFIYNSNTLLDFLYKNNVNFDKNFFSATFTGVSKPLSNHLFDLYNKNYSEFKIENIDNLMKNFINNIKDTISYRIYEDDDKNYVDYYFTALTSFEEKYKTVIYEDPNILMDNYYCEKDKQERIKNRSINLTKLINTNIERCNKKEEKLYATIDKCKSKETYKIEGDLITSYIYNIKKGDNSITVNNFYDDNNEEITIKLDENKTPSENIQMYYKKYNKLKKSEESALEQLEKNQLELDYLNSVLTNLMNCDNYDEVDGIRDELIDTGYIRKRKSNNKKSKGAKPLHFISSEGIDIYVGKNNIQNDHLSLKFANKNFMWLHTKNIPGSHVIVCSTDVPDKTLIEAATIAAYYSKAKSSSKVPVDYTLVKNLKKPNGANPGMVIYHTNYSMFVEPTDFDNLEIKKI